MKKRKFLIISTLIVLALGGCGEITLPSFPGGDTNASGNDSNGSASSTDTSFIYQGHDFGTHRNDRFKKGVIDGCSTADGNYSKDHTLYRSDLSYKAGWQDGRLKCGKKSGGSTKH